MLRDSHQEGVYVRVCVCACEQEHVVIAMGPLSEHSHFAGGPCFAAQSTPVGDVARIRPWYIIWGGACSRVQAGYYRTSSQHLVTHFLTLDTLVSQEGARARAAANHRHSISILGTGTMCCFLEACYFDPPGDG